MTYGQEVAISSLNAGAANFTCDIMRGVVDREQREKALASVGHALAFAIAGTEVIDTRAGSKRVTV